MNNNAITICSVGDLMVCDSPLYVTVGVGSCYQEIRTELFGDCAPIFDEADEVVGNFETVVHTPLDKSLKENQMCCDESILKDLADVGFSVLNIANNHIMQHGAEGFENTKIACEKYGIKPIGIKDAPPYIKTIKDMKLAFLSLCIHLEWYEPDNVLYENSIEKTLNRIKSLKNENSDMIIIVSVHWGDEYATYPSNAQITLAHKMVDIGADIILGHHSHVYQGIEEYNNSLIVYGQGNFVSDMVSEISRQTAVITISIVCNEDSRIITYDLKQYYINDHYIPIEHNEMWTADEVMGKRCLIEEKHTDDEYWDMVRKNHSLAHNSFREYFMKNFNRYSLGIFLRMIYEFSNRKIRRIIGTSTDGRVSSMDTTIYREISKV